MPFCSWYVSFSGVSLVIEMFEICVCRKSMSVRDQIVTGELRILRGSHLPENLPVHLMQSLILSLKLFQHGLLGICLFN